MDWDVKKQEDHLREQTRRVGEELNRARELSKRILQLQHQPGFKEFTEQVRKLRELSVDAMTRRSVTSNEMFRAQGEVRAYDNMLAVMSNAEHALQTLESQIQAHENASRSVLGENGRVTPSQAIWRT